MHSFGHCFMQVFLRVDRPFVELGFTPGAPESGFSFPSNHMTVVTALAFAVYFLNKKLGRFLLIAAVLIGVSRVVLGVHYPLDILGGFILGYFVYYIYKRIFERI
ncbi:MAG: phosphatase PAP2 family protein [Candidatus Paceibacteria bacterium]